MSSSSRQGAIAVSPRPVDKALLAPKKPAAAAVYRTPKEAIDALLGILDLKPGSVLLDLGCGPGDVLIAAAKKTGCWCIGVEIDKDLVDKARKARNDAGLSSKQVEIIYADATKHQAMYRSATHVYMYLHGHLSAELIKLVPESAVVVTYHFPVPGKRCHRICPGGHTFYLIER